MSKIRTTLTVPYLDAAWCVVSHVGGTGRYDPASYHIVYGYAIADLPPVFSAGHVQDYLFQALSEAQEWARLPELIADICVDCHFPRTGPNCPRWNIYRGPEHLPTPPCLFWSWYWGPPDPPLVP